MRGMEGVKIDGRTVPGKNSNGVDFSVRGIEAENSSDIHLSEA